MAQAKAIVIKAGKIQPPKDLQNFTDEQWVGILQTQESKTTQSVLEMCYAWYRMFDSCNEMKENESTGVEANEFNEVRFGDICEKCSISRATASKRVTIGANSTILAPYLDSIPSSVEPLVAICRIADEELELLLKAGNINPEISREEAKYLKDSVVAAKASAKYAGDIQGYIEENPFEKEPAVQKTTGGKEAKKKIKELAEGEKKEEVAKTSRLGKLDDAVDHIVDTILQPEFFDIVIKALVDAIDVSEIIAPADIEDTITDIEKAVETIKLVSGGYE